MSEASERFERNKETIVKAFKEAIEPPPLPKSNKIIPTLLLIALIGTMIPFQLVTTFFSLSFVTMTILSLILIWRNYLRISKYMTTLIVALTATSVMSGCAPAWTFQTSPELIKIAHDHDYQMYTLRKIGILGIGTDMATIEAAQAESDIKNVRAAQIDRGYGLVSIVTITIAGEI